MEKPLAMYFLFEVWLICAVVTFMLKKKNGGLVLDFVGVTLITVLGMLFMIGGAK